MPPNNQRFIITWPSRIKPGRRETDGISRNAAVTEHLMARLNANWPGIDYRVELVKERRAP
jgi:hypothetical protein